MKIIKFFINSSLILVGAVSFASPTLADGLVGTWNAVDSSSRHIKQIDIETKDNLTRMVLWYSAGGKKTPKPGVLELPVSPGEAIRFSEKSKPIKARLETSFSVTDHEVTLTEKGLGLKTLIRYTDDSGRKEQQLYENFVRGKDVENGDGKKKGPKSWSTRKVGLGPGNFGPATAPPRN